MPYENRRTGNTCKHDPTRKKSGGTLIPEQFPCQSHYLLDHLTMPLYLAWDLCPFRSALLIARLLCRRTRGNQIQHNSAPKPASGCPRSAQEVPSNFLWRGPHLKHPTGREPSSFPSPVNGAMPRRALPPFEIPCFCDRNECYKLYVLVTFLQQSHVTGAQPLK